MSRLKGVAVVTGGYSGLRLETTRALVGAGRHAVRVAVPLERGEPRRQRSEQRVVAALVGQVVREPRALSGRKREIEPHEEGQGREEGHGAGEEEAVAHAGPLGRRGVAAVGLNFRSGSGELNRAPRLYHSGDTGDLRHVVGLLRRRFPGRSLAAVEHVAGVVGRAS